MNSVFRIFFACLWMASLSTVSEQAFSAGSVQRRVIEKVKAFQEDWLLNASFTGTFTYESKQFLSEEDALTAKFGEDGLRESVSGHICKKGGKYRMRYRIQRHELIRKSALDPDISPPPEFYDLITNGTFFIQLTHDKEKVKREDPFNGYLSPIEEEEEEELAIIVGRLFKICENPWTWMTEILKVPFSKDDLDKSTIELSDIDGEHVKLTATIKENGKKIWVKEITLRIDLADPEVEQIVILQYDDKTEQIRKKRIQKILEWKISDGRKIPTHIRSEIGTLNPDATAFGEMWFVSQWKCEDIGKRPAVDSDFVVKLDRKDRIAHLSSSFKKRSFHIDELTEDDYNPYVGDYVAIQEQEYSFGKVFFTRLVLLIIGFTFIIFGIFRIYKERKD